MIQHFPRAVVKSLREGKIKIIKYKTQRSSDKIMVAFPARVGSDRKQRI